MDSSLCLSLMTFGCEGFRNENPSDINQGSSPNLRSTENSGGVIAGNPIPPNELTYACFSGSYACQCGILSLLCEDFGLGQEDQRIILNVSDASNRGLSQLLEENQLTSAGYSGKAVRFGPRHPALTARLDKALSNDFVLSFWLKSFHADEPQTIFGSEESTFLSVDTNGVLSSDLPLTFDSDLRLQPDKWTHLSFAKEAEEYSFYLGGQQVAAGEIAPIAERDLLIGGASGKTLLGQMDEILMLNEQASSLDFEKLGRGFLARFPMDSLEDLQSQGATIVPGVDAGALQLFGVDSSLSLRHSLINSGQHDFTLAFWFRTSADGNFLKQNAATDTEINANWFGVQSGKIYLSPDEETIFTGKTELEPNQWHHISIEKFKDSIKVYLNGSVETKGPIEAFSSTGSLVFTGPIDIDDVLIYLRRVSIRPNNHFD